MNSYEMMQSGKCYVFIWYVGHALTHCANCMFPYWEHSHQIGSDGRKHVLIKQEQKDWIRERYDEFTAPIVRAEIKKRRRETEC